jgi:hypothetical protein
MNLILIFWCKLNCENCAIYNKYNINIYIYIYTFLLITDHIKNNEN